jgi:hypothetical protein
MKTPQNRGCDMKQQTFALTCLALAAVGCGGKPADKDIDALDREIGATAKGRNADPAMTAALEDQIMVDPSLNNQANRHSVRPTDEPFQAPIPADDAQSGAARQTSVTLGALAEQQAAGGTASFKNCGLDVDYSMTWATRLPADLPLYPQARVSEAAGKDQDNCHLRAVSFTSPAPVRAMIDFYLTQAKRAGYSAAHTSNGTEHKVAGGRSTDGAAYYILISSAGSGSSVDLVANNGR